MFRNFILIKSEYVFFGPWGSVSRQNADPVGKLTHTVRCAEASGSPATYPSVIIFLLRRSVMVFIKFYL